MSWRQDVTMTFWRLNAASSHRYILIISSPSPRPNYFFEIAFEYAHNKWVLLYIAYIRVIIIVRAPMHITHSSYVSQKSFRFYSQRSDIVTRKELYFLRIYKFRGRRCRKRSTTGKIYLPSELYRVVHNEKCEKHYKRLENII